MFRVQVIGNLGHDAETKVKDGRSFTTFRVAHTDTWTDQAGVKHETTQWIDCVFNDRPPVCEYLKKGTSVYVEGNAQLRCYSSEAARGFVAGCRISVSNIQLIGSKPDAVPSRLYNKQGAMLNVNKHFHCPDATENILLDSAGRQYLVDDNGFVLPMQQAPADVQQVAQQVENQTDQNYDNGKTETESR